MGGCGRTSARVSSLDEAVIAFEPDRAAQREYDHPRSLLSDAALKYSVGGWCPGIPSVRTRPWLDYKPEAGGPALKTQVGHEPNPDSRTAANWNIIRDKIALSQDCGRGSEMQPEQITDCFECYRRLCLYDLDRDDFHKHCGRRSTPDFSSTKSVSVRIPRWSHR